MQTTLKNAVRVIRAADDAEWKAEFERYNYNTYMWVAHIVDDCDYEVEDIETVAVQQDETYGFMCGRETDRRCYDFYVDVYTCKQGKHWVTAEQFEKIG